MGIFDKIFNNTLGKVIGAIGDLIDKNSTTEEERLAARAQLLMISTQAELEMAKMDTEFAELQSKVIIAETQSESWMTRNWRPVTMLGFLMVILYVQMLAPIFGLYAPALPEEMWTALKIGLGGYIVGRSAEKVLPDIVEVMKKDKK